MAESLSGAQTIGGIVVELRAVVPPGEAQKAAQQIKQEVQQAVNSSPVQVKVSGSGGGPGGLPSPAFAGLPPISSNSLFGGARGGAMGFGGVPTVTVGNYGPAGIFAQTQAAVQMSTQQAVVQAAQSAAQAVAGGSSAPGGSRGMSPYMNPFSTRGLARMGMGGLAAFGTKIALDFSAGMGDAYNTMSNPGRVLAGWDSVGSAHNVYGDSAMGGFAQKMATSQGAGQAMDTLKAVPLLGSLAHFADALSGTSASLKDFQSAIQRQVAVHQYLQKADDQNVVGQAALSHDPLRMFDAESSQRLSPFRNIEMQARGTSQHAEAIRTLRESENIDHQRRSQLEAETKSRMHTLDMSAAVSGVSGASIAARMGGDDVRSRHLAHNAELMKLASSYGAQAVGKSYAEQGGIANASNAAIAESRARNSASDAMDDRQHAATMIGLQASAVASSLRAGHRPMAATLVQLGADQSAAILGVTNSDQRRAMGAANNAHYSEVYQSLSEGVSDRSAGYRNARMSAGYRSNRENFRAEVFDFDQEAQQRINRIEDGGERNAAIGAYGAQRWAMVAQRGRDVGNMDFSLTTRVGQAQYLSGASPEAQAAANYGRVRGLYAEVMNADPAIQAHAQGAALMELKALRRGMDPTGGAVAAGVQIGSLVGDPNDYSGRMKERKDMLADMTDAEKAIRGMKVAAGGDNIPGALNFGAGGGAGGKGNDTEVLMLGVLKEIRDQKSIPTWN